MNGRRSKMVFDLKVVIGSLVEFKSIVVIDPPVEAD